MQTTQQHPHTITVEPLDPAKRMRQRPSLSSQNPLIRMPIAPRLVLGFFIPALIAAMAAGIIGVQSTQLLSQTSGFYQDLFQNYASLTTGNDFLQLMDFKLHATLNDALVPAPSHQVLVTDEQAVQGLETRYDSLLRTYIQQDQLTHHPDQEAFFDGAGHPGQAAQQSILASSALRTWEVYRNAVDTVLQRLLAGDVEGALTLDHAQGEVTYADALSALRQLTQFEGRLTLFVQDATALQERSQLITTLIAVVLVVLAIGIIGWLIYGTLVWRLRQVQRIAQSVHQGHFAFRAAVEGRDEITTLSMAVNAMLDTIVGLLEETSTQRDALVEAAMRLFADIRLANGNDMDVSTSIHQDPIGMLSNAFHFTIGRFRRFVQRTQKLIDPLEVLAQQVRGRATTYQTSMQLLLEHGSTSPRGTSLPVEEITRLTGGFTQDVTHWAQQLQEITRQMRVSLEQFRVEAHEDHFPSTLAKGWPPRNDDRLEWR